eukprot:a175641_20.p1 GENE.a175641_20~~a175641_20.p1  ORF type:complete len:512 (+),score=190.68 a175641_20:166-1536(+)
MATRASDLGDESDDADDDDSPERRLEALLLSRTSESADLGHIDAQIDAEYSRDVVFALVTMGHSLSEITKEEGVVHSLGLIMRMREIVSRCAAGSGATLVKAEDGGMFVYFQEPAHALAFCAAVMALSEENNRAVKFPQDALELQIGMDWGGCLVLPGDIYGNAVNCAAKLAEELGTRGQVLVSERIAKHATSKLGLSAKFFERLTAQVSGVSLVHARFFWDEMPNPTKLAVRRRGAPSSFARLCLERLEMASEAERAMAAEAISKMFRTKGVVLISDMSGFTRIALARGIVHFLMLIAQMRAILRKRFEEVGGRIVRTQGDDFKVYFASEAAALRGAITAMRDLRKHNESVKDKEFSTLGVGMGLAYGEFMLVPDERNVFGEVVEMANELGEEQSSAGQIVISAALAARLESFDIAGFITQTTNSETKEFEVDGRVAKCVVLTLKGERAPSVATL